MPTLSKDDIISNVYYSLDTGYGSIQSTLKQAKLKTIQLQ